MQENKQNLELTEPATPEIEQQNKTELQQPAADSTPENSQVKSEKLRYPNADTLY